MSIRYSKIFYIEVCFLILIILSNYVKYLKYFIPNHSKTIVELSPRSGNDILMTSKLIPLGTRSFQALRFKISVF